MRLRDYIIKSRAVARFGLGFYWKSKRVRVRIVRTVAAALVHQACLPVAPQGPPPLPGDFFRLVYFGQEKTN